MYEPGWLIKENGVEVYRESTNGGSDSEPSPVTYTYDLATFTKLPERYEIHNDLTCIGRNELGEFTLSLAECAAKCEKSPTCISFDFQANAPDWASTSTYKCLLSETCTKELATTAPYSLVVKLLSCDASTAPTNGGLGNCTDTLESGSTCQPTCDTGYTLFGERSCVDGTTVDAADCLLPGQPAANPTTLKLVGGRVPRRGTQRREVLLDGPGVRRSRDGAVPGRGLRRYARLGRVAGDGHDGAVRGQDGVQPGYQPVEHVVRDELQRRRSVTRARSTRISVGGVCRRAWTSPGHSSAPTRSRSRCGRGRT